MNAPLLLLLLHCTAVTVSQSCSDGAVEIFGVETDTLIAGRLEICVDGQWFAVYDGGWGDNDAEVVCKQKGFIQNRTSFCHGSCFGASQLTQGYGHFDCGDPSNLEKLTDCTDKEHINETCPNHNAGVICRKGDILNILPVIVEESNAITTSHNASEKNSSTDNSNNWLIATTAALGALSAVLLATLVCVVLGWVRSCSRNRGMAKQKPSGSITALTNPTYVPVTPFTIPPYSVLGPRDTPTSGPSPSPREEQEVIGANYEVPIQRQRNSEKYNEIAQKYEMAPAPGYNKLQHFQI